MNYERVLEKIKPSVFWKDKPVLLQQLKRWSQKELEKVLIKIGETEILMKKNSSLKKDVIIKNLIIELTNNASTS